MKISVNDESLTTSINNTHNHQNGSDSISLNESTNTDNNEHLSSIALNQPEENFKQLYLDQLYNFECERLNFQLNQTVEELNEWEERSNAISDVMYTMMDAICDENETYNSIDAKIIEEAEQEEGVLNGKSNTNLKVTSNNINSAQTVKIALI